MNSIILTDKKDNQVKGPLLIELNSFDDKRGYFYEKWNQKKFDKLVGKPINFVQDTKLYPLYIHRLVKKYNLQGKKFNSEVILQLHVMN